MTVPQQILTIALCGLGTMTMRFLPFLVFSSGRPTPRYVQYLGRVLPPAIFSMLCVYCLKSVTPLTGNHALPELFGVLSTVLLHLWKRNMLLSIAGGTVIYMLLLQFVFV